jgi:oligopeptide transport system ATP-binding protein
MAVYARQGGAGQTVRMGRGHAVFLLPASGSVRLLGRDITPPGAGAAPAAARHAHGLPGRRGFACLFITHDLSTVEYFCDRVAVMYLGRVIEAGVVAR